MIIIIFSPIYGVADPSTLAVVPDRTFLYLIDLMLEL